MVVQQCKSELKDHPFWRSEKHKEDIPTTNKMLKDIVKFKRKWDEVKNKDEKKLKNIILKFFVSIQIEEGIGMGTQEEDTPLDTEQVTEYTRDFLEECENQLTNRKRKYEHSNSQEQIKQIFIEQDNSGTKCAKKLLELQNLYSGYKHIQWEINNLGQEREACSQLLESSFIKDVHEKLMDDLLEGRTKGGIYSKSKRIGSFNGKKFHYPQFETQACDTAIDTLVCNYNSLVSRWKTKINQLNENILEEIFRSAAKFLFTFLQLHPFSDGNGRLGRLLCSYFLELICPFPCSIYNVYSPTEKSDYVKVLVNARKGIDFDQQLQNEEEARDFVGKVFDHDEADLASLIIESNWFTWKQFFNEVGIEID